jgi:cobalt-zinc-cadmium efflux system outer membrane protein
LGNAFPNYNGLNVGLQLPFFSRNQGQIQAARVGQKVAENVQTQAQASIFADVDNALRSLQAYQAQAQFVTPDYLNRLSQLSSQADRAYRNRTIGLLDYLDKFRTYKTGTVNQLDLQKNLFVATETLATAIALP